jgi:hypothetical protein
MNCWKCETEIEISPPEKITSRDSCPQCDRDLHVCRNCRFHDPNAHNECRETQAEWVRDKEKANYCDYFEPGNGNAWKTNNSTNARSAKSAFDKLFKD